MAVSVARCARAWIETRNTLASHGQGRVARCARAWIETRRAWSSVSASTSPAARGRGLKRADFAHALM